MLCPVYRDKNLDSGVNSRVYLYCQMTNPIQIGEAAKLANLSVDAVRFYQKLGLISGPARSPGGYRLFDENQIHDLTFIRRAQELGFSLNQIKQLLALRQKPHACAEVQSILAGKLADVRDKINALSHLEAELGRALRNCNHELSHKREVKHENCCPLLTSLERGNVKGRRSGAIGKRSTRQ